MFTLRVLRHFISFVLISVASSASSYEFYRDEADRLTRAHTLLLEAEKHREGPRALENLAQAEAHGVSTSWIVRTLSEKPNSSVPGSHRHYNEQLTSAYSNKKSETLGQIRAAHKNAKEAKNKTQTENEQLKTQLSVAQSESNQLKGVVAEQTRNVDTLSAQNVALQDQISQQNARMEQLMQMVAQLQSQVNNPGPSFE